MRSRLRSPFTGNRAGRVENPNIPSTNTDRRRSVSANLFWNARARQDHLTSFDFQRQIPRILDLGRRLFHPRRQGCPEVQGENMARVLDSGEQSSDPSVLSMSSVVKEYIPGRLEAKVKSFCAIPRVLAFLKDYILFAEKDEELTPAKRGARPSPRQRRIDPVTHALDGFVPVRKLLVRVIRHHFAAVGILHPKDILGDGLVVVHELGLEMGERVVLVITLP